MKKADHFFAEIYFVESPVEWTTSTLLMDKGVIGPDFLDEDNFMQIEAGLRFGADHVFFFYDSHDYYSLTNILDYLLDILSILDDKRALRMSEKRQETGEVQLAHKSGDLLIFRNGVEPCFDFIASEQYPFYGKHLPYFRNIYVNRENLVIALNDCLEDYFKLAARIIQSYPNKTQSSSLQNMCASWALSGLL